MAIASYTIEELTEAVKVSVSYSDVCRKLNLCPKGATWYWIKKKIIKNDLDVSHFLGKAAKAGPRGSIKKKTADEILVEGKDGRERTHLLRRALLEIGREYKCVVCENPGVWCGKPLQLEIDHINRDRTDCRRENLRFICSNCHSQA